MNLKLNSVLLICTSLLFGSSCKTTSHPATSLPKPIAAATAQSPKPQSNECIPAKTLPSWNHHKYQVLVDGQDVGVEVRTTFPSTGPMGEEVISVSHIVTRHRSHEVEIDRFTVQTERFLKENNTFLRGCFLLIDEASVHLSLVGFNGVGWEKINENLDSIESPFSKTPQPLQLKGDELIGFNLHNYLKDIVTNPTAGPHETSRPYFIPKFDAPAPLDFSHPKKDTRQIGEKKITGYWISALRSGSQRVVLKLFVGENGTIYEEHYPSLHQKRILTNQPLTLPDEYSNPYRGLFSNSYLGFPDGATDATYQIVSKQKIDLKEFSFIADPTNQKIHKINDYTLELTVTAGGPDGATMPSTKDLSSTRYINTNAKLIKDALAYLKSGGKIGFLPKHRRDNAVPIVAQASRIRNPGAFWKNPDKVAKLTSEYVHALLPVKLHTHTMKNATTTLKDGLGDCTEHSVLFASLMRAANIPTKLVSGMYLTHGGSWVFHMWNEYWDGTQWNSIDTSIGPKLHPGANYVALSRGAADFEEHRHNIAFFLDRSFSGLEFNLTEAGASGEALHLAKPKRIAFSGNDAVIFEALTLSNRGDYKRAFEFVSKKFNPDTSPLNLELLRADLFFRVGKYDEALNQIQLLRQKTSLPINVFMLDKLEFDLYIEQKNTTEAALVLERLADALGENEPLFLQQKARYLLATNNMEKALSTIDNALLTDDYDANLMATYVDIAARNAKKLSTKVIETAVERAWYSLYLTHYASPVVLKSAATLFFHIGAYEKAGPLMEHALLMTPNDPELNDWLQQLKPNCTQF